jgi:hypothetical protein
MHKFLLGFAAVALSSAAHAAVTIDLGTAGGNLGSSQPYSNGGFSIAATGYASSGTTLVPGPKANLWGKNGIADERGLGLAGDPSKEHEIYYGGSDNFASHAFVQIDIKDLISKHALGATFFTGSTTNHEEWRVYGSNAAGSFTNLSLLTTGNDESSYALPSFGTYRYYDFVSGGTVSLNNDDERDNSPTRQAGNFLLAGLSVTPAIPEPATWAMMLVGFGAVGFSIRRRQTNAVRQLA